MHFRLKGQKGVLLLFCFLNSVIKFQMLPFLGIWSFQRPIPFTQTPCATTPGPMPVCPFYTSRFTREIVYDNIYVLLVTILGKREG